MNFPKRHDLACYDGQFLFEDYGICPQQWEISVPLKHGIMWSVVLSYLKSANLTTRGQLEDRVQQLTEGHLDPELARVAIAGFNPFFNIHRCFFDETLQKIFQMFRQHFFNKHPDCRKKVRQTLQNISTFLKINILMVDLIERKLNVVEPTQDFNANVAHVVLFYKKHISEDDNELKRFHFGLSDDICCELRKNALGIILETSEIKLEAEKELIPMLDRREKDINLVITLLKKNSASSVSHLYESSYIAGKLADAGFETDPSVLDSDGFSAFHYALQSSDKNLVYTLYRYAANSCYESENTFRNPDPNIISNFPKLNKILKENCTPSNRFDNRCDRSELIRMNYEDLLRFNEFLTGFSRGINDIRIRYPNGDVNDNGIQNSSIQEAAKQREIILLILDMYVNFFSVEAFDFSIPEAKLIENYTNHKTFYDNLDLTVSLLFFDNIFLLKGVLKAPDEHMYSELESSFLLSVITNQYFTSESQNKYENINIYLQDLGFDLNCINLSLIPLLERLNLRENIKRFCRILRGKELLESDLVKCIPGDEISEMLRDFSELKDEFLIFRLDHYLKAALETVPTALKQKVVIQRGLQVIGESINIEKENPSSIKHLLRACLPDSTLHVLKKARNVLSHFESFQFPFKFKTEQDDDLFGSIQSEIRSIKETFEEVFDIQRVRLMEFLVSRGLESIQKFQQSPDFASSIGDHPLLKPLNEFKEALGKRSSNFMVALVQKKKIELRVSVPTIDEFCRVVRGYASRGDEGRIRAEIPAKVQIQVEAIGELILDLKAGTNINEERFDVLFLKSKEKSTIAKDYKKYLLGEPEGNASKAPERSKDSQLKGLLKKVEKSPDPLKILNLIFKKNKVSDSQWKALNDVVCFSDDARGKLEKLIRISKSPFGENLANLLNRIEHLKQMAIDEQYDVRFLWERAKSSKARQYLAYKIVQRYFRESTFQASLEMLLFDCVSILEKNEGLKCFWLKTSYLFNGIDVRNVLAHGDPLLESIGSVLDPKDFPSELVGKMLQLFHDQDCIEALSDLWEEMKQSGHIAENCDVCNKLKERVKRCDRWLEYCKLLKEDPKKSETYKKTVLFLETEPQPRRKHKKNSTSNSL